MIGLQTHHAFAKRPTFVALSKQNDSLSALVAELRKPEVKARILSEEDLPPDESSLFDGMTGVVRMMLHKLYVIGAPPDYEPTEDRTVAGIAKAQGADPFETLYDLYLEQDGRAMLMMPMFNYYEGNHDVIREQRTHPYAVSGLSDRGAHCGMICDASIPTFMLTHWARDRKRGEKLDLEWIVKKQSKDTAELFGLTDRGSLEVGRRAMSTSSTTSISLCARLVWHSTCPQAAVASCRKPLATITRSSPGRSRASKARTPGPGPAAWFAARAKGLRAACQASFEQFFAPALAACSRGCGGAVARGDAR